MSPRTWTSEIRTTLSLLESRLPPLSLDVTPFCLPPLLARHPPSTRRSALSRLRDSEEALGSIISTIDDLQRQIDDLRREASVRQARCTNARTPILALPAEVLREIFALVVAENRTIHPAIHLSHICQSWRRECFSQSRLWPTASLPMHPEGQALYDQHSEFQTPNHFPRRLALVLQLL